MSVKLQSSDDVVFDVSPDVANMSQVIADMLRDVGTDVIVPVPNVTSATLAKVIEYCKYHLENPSTEVTTRISPWDAQFCNVDNTMLFSLILAAHGMKISTLLDLTCMTVANMIQGKTPEEVRTTFALAP